MASAIQSMLHRGTIFLMCIQVFGDSEPIITVCHVRQQCHAPMPQQVRTEEGLLAYLEALQALGGADVMRNLGVVTRLRLQNELYSLTTPGG